MEENNKWLYKVSSHARTNGLTNDEIDGILNCYKHEEYQDFRNEMREKNKEYDQNVVAKWQLEKSDTIEQTWHENLSYEVKDNEVFVKVEFELNLPEEFDKSDVVEWCEGFHRLLGIHPMIAMKEIVKSHETGSEMPDYNKFTKFLKELSHNQTIVVKKI